MMRRIEKLQKRAGRLGHNSPTLNLKKLTAEHAESAEKREKKEESLLPFLRDLCGLCGALFFPRLVTTKNSPPSTRRAPRRERKRRSLFSRFSAISAVRFSSPDPRPPTPDPERHGVVLLVVLGMTALIALLGISFVIFTGQDEASARAGSDAVSKSDPPEVSLDIALQALLCGTDDPTATIRGHSLCRDLWGNDVVGRWVNVGGPTAVFRPAIVVFDTIGNGIDPNQYPVPDPGKFNLEINLDPLQLPPSTPVVPQSRGYLTGRTLLFKGDSPLAGQTTTIVSYEAVNDNRVTSPPGSLIALVRVSPPLPAIPLDQDEVIILQRPFNGAGDRNLTVVGETRTLYPPESQNINFVYNNRDPETRRDGFGVLQPIGGFDEPWDMADLQNLFLAAIGSFDLLDSFGNPGFDGFLDTTQVILPSFFRPVPGPDGTVGGPDDTLDWTNPRDFAFPGDDPRRRLLRPRPVDQLARGVDGIIGWNTVAANTDDGAGPDGVLGLPAAPGDDDANPGLDGIWGTLDDLATVPERVISLPQFLTFNTFGGLIGNGIQQVAVEVGQDLDGDGNPDVLAIPADGVPVDVDNDGDGKPDSIWTDAGLPVETRPDGTRAKPLVAFLVVDQDSKLNLNLHGNHAMDDIPGAVPYRLFDRNADGTNDTILVHGSNLGASPSEINLGRAFYSKIQDLLDNDGSGTADDIGEFEPVDGIDNDGDGITDEQPIADELEFLAVLSGRTDDPNFGVVEGRYGEIGVLNGVGSPSKAGLTFDGGFVPLDDDGDNLFWRRFGSSTLPTEIIPATVPPTYLWLGNTEVSGNPVRNLFGLPDFDGDAYDQLRPWHMTWWGTVYNPDDQIPGGREDMAAIQRAFQTTLSRWATHNPGANDFENVNEADEQSPYALGPYDAPYTMNDLEWLLRGHDLGGGELESRLGNSLALLSFWSRNDPLQPTGPFRDLTTNEPILSTDGLLRRRHFTTQSWDFADYGLMPDFWREDPATVPDQRTTTALAFPALLNGDFNPQGEVLPLVPPSNPLLPRLRPDPVVPIPVERVMAPDLAAGLRLNLNFPLGDGIDLDMFAVQDGVVDELTEVIDLDNTTPLAQYAINLTPAIGIPSPMAGKWRLTGLELRELQAHQIYGLLRQIASPDDGTANLYAPFSMYQAEDFDDDDGMSIVMPGTAFDAGLLGQLAQLAVNIVDFRDPDNFPTRFEFGAAAGEVVFGVERPEVVINETLIYLEEVDDDNDDIGDEFPQAVGDFGLWVELYNPGHPDRLTTTTVDLTNYRLVLAKDNDNDNRPDQASAQIFGFVAAPFTTIAGGEYLVTGTSPTANGTTIPPNPFVPMAFDLAPVALEFQTTIFRWKVFLQRSTGGDWVTVDQSRLRIWVNPFLDAMGMPLPMHEIDPDQRIAGPTQLVSRERREPFRGGPDDNVVVRPGVSADPIIVRYEEYNDVSSLAGVPGGSAIRSHPDRIVATDPTHTLGALNWHSDVDDQNGDRMDMRALTFTQPGPFPLGDTNGDGFSDLGDLDGDLVDTDAVGTPLNPQLDGVPTVAWPPLPFDDPLIATDYQPSRAVGFDFVPWLNRDFANVGELLLVPGVPSNTLTAAFHPEAGPPGGMVGTPGGRYEYLADFFEENTPGSVAAANGGPRGLHRLFEFVEVPSRVRGAVETQFDPATQPEELFATENRNRRVPGKLNLNTIQDPLVYEGLIDSPLAVFPVPLPVLPMQVPAPQVLFTRLVTARDGVDGFLGTTDDQPFVFGADGFDGAASRNFSLLRGPSSNALFSLPDDFGNQVAFPYDWMGTGRTGEYRNPWFKNELLRKISSQVTNRSNVFAVWITVGYFEVLEEPLADGADNDGDGELNSPVDGFGRRVADGIDNPPLNGLIDEGIDEPDELMPRLGREIGSATGNVTRHRSFHVIDRSRSVGFDPDLDNGDMEIFRRIIE